MSNTKNPLSLKNFQKNYDCLHISIELFNDDDDFFSFLKYGYLVGYINDAGYLYVYESV